MRLVYCRRRRGEIERVTVPPELEPFARYLFERGYNESTVAHIVRNVRRIFERGLTERDLEQMSGTRARELRYAYRRYKEFCQWRGG